MIDIHDNRGDTRYDTRSNTRIWLSLLRKMHSYLSLSLSLVPFPFLSLSLSLSRVSLWSLPRTFVGVVSSGFRWGCNPQ
jgi:hypothetical protein